MVFGKGQTKNINNLNQEVNNVSEIDNPNNYNQMESVETDPKIIKPHDTMQAIDEINQLYTDVGYDDVGEFMSNISAAESNVGADTMGDHSYSPFQIDAMRYRDIVERAQAGGAAGDRAQLANQYLREALGDEDFDILSLLEGVSTEGGERYSESDILSNHNPLVGAALTRMGLANIKESVPQDIFGQADYWKRHWNKSGAGNVQKFVDQSRANFPDRYITNPMSQQSLTP